MNLWRSIRIALDKWGIRKTGTLFGLLGTCGAFIVAFGSKGVFGQDEKTMLTDILRMKSHNINAVRKGFRL